MNPMKTPSKAYQLKRLLDSDEVTYALEAHHAASALIAEEVGFKVIWASGLTLSASLGHRDCNELSWTNLCEQFEYMADATNIPILVDGDTGFGNFNNVRELVRKLDKYGVAGVCLEDKVFPKTNSFLPYNQSLSSIEEFTGKIRAAKDSQIDSHFCVVARTEAFIAGHGLEEALERAYAYQKAGADAILIHSKKSTIEEIESFCQHWDYSAPLVIVPTKYASTPSEMYQRLGISMVIWANHIFRASLTAMRNAAEQIFREQSVSGIEKEIASLDDIFDLVDENELKQAEGRYNSVDLKL
jgi:phosphoenolpyruvate phosphomutase